MFDDSMKQLFKYAKISPHLHFRTSLNNKHDKVLKRKDKFCPQVIRAAIGIRLKHNSTINV